MVSRGFSHEGSLLDIGGESKRNPRGRYIEFDFLAVLDDSKNTCLEQGCAECFKLHGLPVNLEQLKMHNERVYNDNKNSLHSPFIADAVYAAELSSNFCCRSGRDTLYWAFDLDCIRLPSSAGMDHACDKCTVDMPSGKLQVDFAAMEQFVESAPKDCSLICQWTSKPRSLSTHSDRMFSPETHLMKTETQVNTECMPMTTELQPTTTEPQKNIIKHHPINSSIHLMKTKPQMMKNKSWPVSSKHQTTNTESQLMNNEPRSLRSEPQTMTAEAQTMDTETQTIKADPQTMNTKPQTLKADPQTIHTEPQRIKADPRAINTIPQTIKAEPKTMNSEPYTLKAESQTMSFEPLAVFIDFLPALKYPSPKQLALLWVNLVLQA